MSQEWVVFGAGQGGRNVYRALKKKGDKVSSFVDNDSSKHEMELCGKRILSPDNMVKEFKDDSKVIIASMYDFEIFEQLTELGISGAQIEIAPSEWLTPPKASSDSLIVKLAIFVILILFTGWFWSVGTQ